MTLTLQITAHRSSAYKPATDEALRSFQRAWEYRLTSLLTDCLAGADWQLDELLVQLSVNDELKLLEQWKAREELERKAAEEAES